MAAKRVSTRDYYRGALMGRKQPKGLNTKYAVVQDQLGVAYLRVAEETNGDMLLILNTGKIVELVKIDKKTAKSRDIRPVIGVDLAATVSLLMNPQSSDTKISERARQYLTQIKEELHTNMTAIKKGASIPVATKKVKGQTATSAQTAAIDKAVNKAVKEAKTPKAEKAPKTAAKKEAKAEKKTSTATSEQTWTFVKVGEATGQRAVILEVLKTIGGKASRSKLAAALTKKLDSSQDSNTVLSLKKKFLVDNGCVKIS